MNIKLVQYPDPILLQVAEPITDFKEAEEIAFNLRVAIRLEGGLIGLAAPQIGIGKAVAMAWIGEEGGWVTMVNPKVTEYGIERVTEIEGCGSLRDPVLQYEVERPKDVSVSFYDVQGHKMGVKLTDLPSRVAQHEIDHLNGHLINEHGKPVSS